MKPNLSKPPRSRWGALRRTVLRATLIAGLCGVAQAQLGLSRVTGAVSGVTTTLTQQVQGTASSALGQVDAAAQTALRAARVRTLLANNRDVLEADPNGAPIVRSRLLAIAPSDVALAAARAAGFTALDDTTLDGVGLRVIVLAVPAQLATAAALRRLRALDPAGSYDYDHIYTESGVSESPTSSPAARNSADSGTAGAANSAGSAAAPVATSTRIGLIDGGVDASHPAFKDITLQHWGCAGRSLPDAHGTAVASLLVGRAGAFHGAAPGAQLFAADVYCGAPTGGAVLSIAQALGWLAQQQVPVINISLVGPANALLEQSVRALQARGHLIVAAVGNDGPAAPPLYPAAYPGVIGVTGVDAHQHVLLEAARGKQVRFAAPGMDMAAAGLGDTYISVRGTSFAAPIVAGLLALRLATPERAAADAAVTALAATAVDLGSHGVDKTYGCGLVGESARIALAAVGISSGGATPTTLRD